MRFSSLGVDILQLTLSKDSFLLFKDFIKQRTGIDIKENKMYLVETRLNKVLYDLNKNSFEELYDELEGGKNQKLAEIIIDAITINETFWFRDVFPWLVINGILIPKFIDDFRNNKTEKIRIWSAAASTGQEAYSTAICIFEYLKRNKINDVKVSDFEILATDINNTVIESARKGYYDFNSMKRGLNETYKERYFTKKDKGWVLRDNIREMVTFKNLNLKEDFVELGIFHIIFCRYVLIYFTPELKFKIMKRIIDRCIPKGTIFFGASEIIKTENLNIRPTKYLTNNYYLKP
jgi:chemotaxis protein methyltransferase CheR